MTLSNVQQRYGLLWTAILTSLSILLLWGGSRAQVTTTITPDPTLGTEVNQNGKVHDITGGDRPEAGPNLFHSFHRFHIGIGDTAHFIGQPGIENIIGRVTGPEASRIDGTLQADASLFLLNPQGILFGPDATLNIHGSFHASTADVLRFADGAEFSTRLSEKSTLTVAAPSAFGFLRANPNGIAIQGSELAVPEGETLSMIGGDIAIMGDGDPAGTPNLAASGGRINLASVASSGNVVFDPASPLSRIDVGSVDQIELGHIDIVAGAWIDVSGEGGGAVVIRGGRLRMDHSWLFANTLGHLDGAEVGVDIEVDELVLTNEGRVTTDVGELGAGNAGNLSIVTRHLRVDGGAHIGSSTFGLGKGGTVTVQAAELTLEAGAIRATAERKAEGAGDAGVIVVEAQQIRLTEGAQIVSATFGPDKGGTVTVRATEVSLEGATTDSRFLRGIFATAQGEGEGAGNAGDVVVEAQQVRLAEGAIISSSTDGPGKGGNITLHGSQLLLANGATISSESSGEGNAGTIQVEVSDLTLRDQSIITTASTQAGGGNIEIEAQTVSLVDSDMTAMVGSGEGSSGNIRIGGMINADGDIIESLDRLKLERSRITANTDAGDGANIVMGARQVVLDSNSAIAANTNAGVGGNVAIAGTVAADGQALSRAGTIVLRESQITASAQAGQGGRIDIVAEVFLADPDSVVDASSQLGIDGEVNIEAVVSNLSEVVMPLSQRLGSETPLLRDRCATRLQQGLISSFVERERAGIPSAPDGLLPSRLDVSDAEVAWSGESLPHGVAMASEPSWRLSSGCP